ncbi:hypothetical protein DPMN_034567 [Dreissena polymorpha]|uniref:G-protein coupled receptors family 1 profile domain-containing protein n=1 Tax=Dreissena polymorpha TaxID=45954 RepID=A0A9D4M7R9_DREPO|nr:hypothetical protein DPMN_034567 [Dreissena polymorpha]
MCKLINFFPIFLTTCSCYTLVFISIERRRALVQSMRPQISVPQALKALPFIWLGSVVVGIPTLIEFSVVPLTTDSSDINSGNYLYVSQLNNNSVERHLHCGTNNFPRTLGMANCFLVTLFAFVIPLTLISINYVQLVVFVNKPLPHRGTATPKQKRRRGAACGDFCFAADEYTLV